MEEELLAESYKRGYDWNGYEVYEPTYKEYIEIGVPSVVLVKGNEVRVSDVDESFEYLKYSQMKEFQNKSSNDLSDNLKEEI